MTDNRAEIVLYGVVPLDLLDDSLPEANHDTVNKYFGKLKLGLDWH